MIKNEVIFKNFSDNNFTHSFDGQEYTFVPGKDYRMEKGEALHFQKHLINRELTEREDKRIEDGGKGKEIRTNNEKARKELEAKCIFEVNDEVTKEEVETEESKEEEFAGVEK